MTNDKYYIRVGKSNTYRLFQKYIIKIKYVEIMKQNAAKSSIAKIIGSCGLDRNLN